MSVRKQKLIKLGNIHGFSIKGFPVKYDTLKDAVADANKFATFKDAYIVVYGKSKQGVVRKKKRSKSVRRSAQIYYDEAGRYVGGWRKFSRQ